MVEDISKMAGNLQLVDGLVWVFACCGHAGEDGHDDHEDREVLHFRFGLVWFGFVEGCGFSRLLVGEVLMERGEWRCLWMWTPSVCTLFRLTTILRCLLGAEAGGRGGVDKEPGSAIRTWTYASGMLNGQCYIGHYSPAVCAIVMFVTSHCRLEIDPPWRTIGTRRAIFMVGAKNVARTKCASDYTGRRYLLYIYFLVSHCDVDLDNDNN